jgi:hypothetical protein
MLPSPIKAHPYKYLKKYQQMEQQKNASGRGQFEESHEKTNSKSYEIASG